MIVMLYFSYLYTEADIPSGLVLRQTGSNSIEISWTVPVIPPRGYSIFIRKEDRVTVVNAFRPPYALHNLSDDITISVHIQALSLHFPSELMGPENITLGEDIVH